MFEIAQLCNLEVLKSYHSENISHLGANNIFCTLLKKKFVNRLQRIGHVVYIKGTHEAWDFCKLSTPTSLFCNI